MSARFRFAAILVLALGIHACGGGDGPPPPTEVVPQPGTLEVRLQSPNPDDGGLLLRVSGPGIRSVAASGALVGFATTVPGGVRVMLVGPVGSGTVLLVDVDDVNKSASYTAVVEQAAQAGTFAQRDLAGYGLTVTR